VAAETSPEALERADLDGPIEIADRIWWVGHYLPGDPFQCHVYLIEHGDESVLIDPGGLLTLDRVLEKVRSVISFERIRWFVCQHQDPDITASLPRIDEMVSRSDAVVVSHWRAKALIRHYGIGLPFWLVEEHDWQLDLGGRVLRFVFTPYLHFPGAFTTFDETTGTLFSSDLFGGFTEHWKLVATDLSYYEEIRPFHEHYMPSRDILAAGMQSLEQLPIRMIAPQHGELIPEKLVQPIMERLKNLDCGLYLMVHRDTDIRRLSEMNRFLHQALSQIIVSRDFQEIAAALVELTQEVLPLEALEFYARDSDSQLLYFAPSNRYRGVQADIPGEYRELLGSTKPQDRARLPIAISTDSLAIGIPLFSPTTERSEAVAVLRLREPVPLVEAGISALAEISTPLEVAVERELLMRSVELKRQEFYELAMRDTLTGLYNRLYLHEAAHRLCALQDRGEVTNVTVTMFDLDHFKAVNDTYGHAAGDEVLRRFGTVLRATVREGDLVARIGGEEFIGLHLTMHPAQSREFAERVCDATRNLTFVGSLEKLRITVSAGVTLRKTGESIDLVVARADGALYLAKSGGRDQVIEAAESRPI
jgi:diguanylate cyclase (GGDEF)-like protein